MPRRDPLADLGDAARAGLIASVGWPGSPGSSWFDLRRSAERPRVRSGDVRVGVAVLWVTAVLVVASCVIAGAQLADDIRQTRAMVQDRCHR